MSTIFPRVISADSHVMEPPDLWQKALGDRYADHTPRLLDQHLGKPGTYFFTGHQVLKYGRSDYEAQKIGFQQAGFMPEVRVRFQKEAGVDAELLNATYMLLIMQGRQRAVVRAAARVFNDFLADFCAYDPRRLIGIAMIPMDDIDWSIAELERVAKRGLRGAIIHLYPPEGCAPYRDRLYDRFWASAQALDMPLTLHIITGRVPDPLHFHTREEHGESPKAQVALMYEVMEVLANEFIFGTILDRFPTLKLQCSEFEISWIPTFMWRLNQMQEDFGARLELPTLAQRAGDYMKTRIWHGFIDDPYPRHALEHIGAGQILWGSDFPHVRSIGLNAQDRLAELFAGMSRAEQADLVAGNVAKLYNL